ncbi:MerR family transcriptional regulator [Methylobacterium sp. E-045]|uniref:MerR family transcriptional regulator n=1 Tax=Methylobacterium sp. E-045 TaxID=2836575 RepID=UPI001FB9ECC6|nr:MerR family transcriptional regulator [Methylobacterium sp. E-045]MCJ2132055.1 MerR family transcriptional regulator [Methylobacterium sp. E-045]
MPLAAKVPVETARGGEGPFEVSLSGSADGRDTVEKRPGAFRTISEVADELDVPQHVLRFWETKFAQVRPVKRAGGRRYYRPEDVDLIKGIRRLLHEQGYTIRGAQRVLKENGIRFVQSVGRGEAEVAAPIPRDLEAGEDEADDEAGHATAREDDRLGADRSTLQAVLDDLHACRDALRKLRDPSDPAIRS